MSSFMVPQGSPTLAMTSAKTWVNGTGSIFRVEGTVAVHSFFGVNTVQYPSADIYIRMQISSSLDGGIAYLSNNTPTFFTEYAVGSTILIPPSAGSGMAFNSAGSSDLQRTIFYLSPGVINFLANNTTPATRWYMFYTPMTPTASVIPL